jgi:16S rRNA (cytosine967-C5)-methyltransferase
MNYQSKSFKRIYSDWMDELGVKELGEKVWATEITAQNQPAKVVLSKHTTKRSFERP